MMIFPVSSPSSERDVSHEGFSGMIKIVGAVASSSRVQLGATNKSHETLCFMITITWWGYVAPNFNDS